MPSYCFYFLGLLWPYLGLAETCLDREENGDDLASVSLLQSHMSLDSSLLEPNRSSSQLQAKKIASANASSIVALATASQKVGTNERLAADIGAHNLDAGADSKITQSSESALKSSPSVEAPPQAKLKENVADSWNDTLTEDEEDDDALGDLPQVQPERVNVRSAISLSASGIVALVLVYAMIRRHFPDLALPFLVSVAYIAVSSSLISFNKYIMKDTVFPYAMALTTLHMTTTWIGLFALYCMKPEMFPQMQLAPKGAEILGVSYSLPQYFIPIGCFFAFGLFGANAAYHYCSVAFLQFMKETNVVWLFCLCVAMGTQQFTKAKVFTIIWIVTGASLAITGEMNFVLIGFFLQLLSQAGEVAKNVLGEWMMTTSNFKLDALTYTLSLAPMALLPLAIGTACTYQPQMIVAFMSNIFLLSMNACMAVVLNVCISLVIKHCSAIAFILIGMVKDIFIVLLSTALFGDTITAQQVFGFAVCLSGIAAYSSIKLKPEWWQWLSPAKA